MSKSAQQTLNELLGFDPTKNSGGNDVLSSALAEIQAKKAMENKEKAKELISKAIDTSTKMADVRKQFEGQMKKSEKELAKLVNSIKALGGQAVPQEDDSDS